MEIKQDSKQLNPLCISMQQQLYTPKFLNLHKKKKKGQKVYAESNFKLESCAGVRVSALKAHSSSSAVP